MEFDLQRVKLEKPFPFDPFGQTGFAHLGHNKIDPFGQNNVAPYYKCF